MSVSILNSFIEPTTVLAISSEPDGFAAIGNLFQMISLAIHDPEGCVRFNPNSSMDPETFSRYFNCAVAMVSKSIETLQKFNVLTVEDGKIYINLLRDQKQKRTAALLNEAKAAEARAKGAARTAAWRASQKFATARAKKSPEKSKEMLAQTATGNVTGIVTESHNETVTDPVTENLKNRSGKIAESRAAAGVAENANGTCNAKSNAGERSTSVSNINNNLYADKPISLYADKANKADKNYAESNIGVLSAQAGEKQEKLSLDKLPAPCRRVLNAWNRLPVQKFDGLIPALQKKLEVLLSRYGEAAILKAIAGIAKSAFLLGKKGTGWIITFSWLLDPGNFAKVLSGKYLDNNSISTGYADWFPGERCPFYLPGEGDEELTGEAREQALYALAHPTNPRLEKAKRLLA